MAAKPIPRDGMIVLCFDKNKRELVSGDKSSILANTFHWVIVECANWMKDPGGELHGRQEHPP
jgi:hypothetical protein